MLDEDFAGRLVDLLDCSVSQRLGPVGSGRRGMLTVLGISRQREGNEK